MGNQIEGGSEVNQLRLNTQLLRHVDIKLPAVFCLKFNRAKRELYYIGANHTDKESSPTFKIIDKVIPLCDAVVVEGYSGPNPLADRGEGGHAIAAAKKAGIYVYGAETPVNIFCKEISGRFSLDDIKGWAFLVIARQSFDQDKAEADMWKDYKAYGPWYTKMIGGPANTFDPRTWFRTTFGRDYQYGKFLDHSSPKAGPQISRQIARAIASLREPHLLINLYNVLGRHQKVAYVIGRDHIHRDLPVLLDTFGSYEKI